MRGVPHVIRGVCMRFPTCVRFRTLFIWVEVPRVREVPRACSMVMLGRSPMGMRFLTSCDVNVISYAANPHCKVPHLHEFPHVCPPPVRASTSRSARIELGLHLPSHVVSAFPLNGFTW